MPMWDLRCPVPSTGAHRLAWALGLEPDPVAAVTALEVQIGVNAVERLLRGELEPGWSMGAHIEQATRGFVTTQMFYDRNPSSRRMLSNSWGPLRWWEVPSGLRLPKTLKKAA